MKKFRILVYKEFIHIWRDKRTLIILLLMPAALIILFGFAITNEIKDAPIGLYDKSKDNLSKRITDNILNSQYFKLIEIIESESDLINAFRKGNVKMILVFENDFEKNLLKSNLSNLQIISDASDPNTSNTLINYAQSMINNIIKSEYNTESNFNIDVKMRYNPEMKGAFLFVPGLITTLMLLIGTMMTSLSLTKEREHGSMEYLLTSPLSPLIIILSKLVPYFIISVIDIVTILILGDVVFGVKVQGSLVLLIFEGLLFIILSLSLGLLISTVSKSQQIALMISLMGLMLPTILLSDFIFPISNMPILLQVIANVIPAKWFNTIIKSIMLKGADFSIIWKETLILITYIVVFISLSLFKFKVRLD